MTVKVVVNGQSLSWYDRSPKIAADSIEFVKFKFLLSEEWDDHVVVAQFSQKGATYNKVLEDGCCTLPVEIEDGKCFISIFGQIPGGPERATVIPLLTDVSLSGFVGNGETPIPPTPDLYSQLIDYFSKNSSGGAGAVDPEDIAQAVEDYLTEHPIEGVGKPGYSPTVEVTNTEKGTKVVITDVNGPQDFEIPDGVSGVYVLAEGETLEDAPEDADVVIDPFGEPDVDPGSDILFVDITKGEDEGYASSHSASEIKNCIDNGGFAVGRYENKNMLVSAIEEDHVLFVYHIPGGIKSEIYEVHEDKTVKMLVATHGCISSDGIPAGGKAGQYLCKLSDKNYDAAWVDLVIPEQYGLITYDQTKTITVT